MTKAILVSIAFLFFINYTESTFISQKKLLIGTLCDCRITTNVQPSFCRTQSRQFRSIDGTCNNLQFPNWGASETEVPRFLRAQFFDDIAPNGTPRGFDTPFGHPFLYQKNAPSAQEVSDNILQIVDRDDGNNNQVSHIYMTFGQFIDHDLVYMLFDREACIGTKCKIPKDFIYPCFPIFPTNKGTECVRLVRSFAACQDPRLPRQVRNNVNNITSYLDGSMIYGSEERIAKLVRDWNPSSNGALLAVNKKFGDPNNLRLSLLPFDFELDEPCNEDRQRGGCFLGGDVRASENTALAGMHTIFVRLHNLYATQLLAAYNRRPLSLLQRRQLPEKVFQITRKIVGAIVQSITYNDWLPFIVNLPEFKGYNPRLDAGIRNVFGTAAFRFGHTLVKNAFQQVNANFDNVRRPTPIRNTFFDMRPIFRDGIEPTMLGLVANESETVDTRISASIGRDLFIPPRKRGFQNLAALNIQRGRDHGIPSYTEWLKFCRPRRGLRSTPIRSFNDFFEIKSVSARASLQRLYKTVDNYIDPFPAMLAEEPTNGKLLGPTMQCIIQDQFIRLRDGDRFYFENSGLFTRDQLAEIKKMCLRNVMCETLNGIVSLQEDVFKAFPGPDILRRRRRRRRPACPKNVLDINKFVI